MDNIKKIFGPVQSQRIPNLVEDRIKQAIFDNSFRIGEKIPSQRELAEMFGVSRSSVRQALLSLEKSGFIVIKKGATGGGIIAEVGTKSAVDSIKDLINLMQVTLQDIAQVRLILEPPICALAAVKATQNDIGRLREWNEKLRDGFCSGDPIFEHNPRIHTLIAEISGNPLFGILIKALMEVHAYRMLSISLSDEVKKNIIYHHERIIDALEQKEKEEVYRCMEQHICQVREDLSNLEKRGG